MEEIQKKTRKANTTSKEPKVAKTTTTVAKETKVTKAVASKKEPKTTREAATTKQPKTQKEVSKTTKSATAKKETKTTKEPKVTKTVSTVKEPKTEKVSTTKKVAKTSSVTKDAKAPRKNTVKSETHEEPQITIIHEKKQNQEQPKEFTKKQKQIKTENNKQPRRYIDISIGAIVCAIIIIILLVFNVKLGVRAYNVMTKEEKANSNLEIDDDVTVTQEIGNVLNSKHKLVAEMQEKLTLPQNVVASIYKKQAFNTNTITNELKLMIGWAKTKSEDKLISINENNQQVEALEKDKMKETIKSIFGEEIKHKDEEFNNTSMDVFSANCTNCGEISYKDGLYTNITNKNVENEMSPLIYQEIEKVVKYTETLVVYTKVAYINVEDYKYIVYKDCNKNQFKEKLLEIEPLELFGQGYPNPSTGEGTITIDPNEGLDSIREQLYTYKYTFTLNEETGEYYLSKFNKSLAKE